MDDLRSTQPSALQKDAQVIASCKNCAKLIVEGGISIATAIVCQTPLFFAQMVEAQGFDVAIVLEK